MCGDSSEETALVAELTSGQVLLQNDGDFPGYCILVHRRHVTELFQLDEVERCQMMEDITRIARAIQRVSQPKKLNYAILGNEVPHLHCHVIPRKPDDGYWGKPIWARPAAEKAILDTEAFTQLKVALTDAIAADEENEEIEEEME